MSSNESSPRCHVSRFASSDPVLEAQVKPSSDYDLLMMVRKAMPLSSTRTEMHAAYEAIDELLARAEQRPAGGADDPMREPTVHCPKCGSEKVVEPTEPKWMALARSTMPRSGFVADDARICRETAAYLRRKDGHEGPDSMWMDNLAARLEVAAPGHSPGHPETPTADRPHETGGKS